MLNFRTEEITVVVFFALLHLVFYHHFSNLPVATEKTNPLPVFIALIHPKPKPVVPIPKPEPKILPAKKVLLPKQPPKVLKKLLKRVVEKPRLQQKSVVKVQAEEVIEKEQVERPQQLSEAVVKKVDTKPEKETVEKAEVAEPAHESVVTKAEYGSSCRSALNRYPAEAKEQGIEGTVKIKVQILADGNVGNTTITKSSGSDLLDNSVLEHVRDCDFEPAQKDGVPITSSVIIPVRFKLDN